VFVSPFHYYVESCEELATYFPGVGSHRHSSRGIATVTAQVTDSIGTGFTYPTSSKWRRLFARSTLGSSTVSGVLATIAARCSDMDRASSGTMGMMPSRLALLVGVRSVGTNDPSWVISICRPASSSESMSSPRRKRANNRNASASETVVRSLTSPSWASIRCCSDSSAAFRDLVG
jgi:hypothetical protein